VRRGYAWRFLSDSSCIRWRFKMSSTLFCRIADRRAQEKNIPVISPRGRMRKSAPSCKRLQSSARVLDLGGKINLKELGALIRLESWNHLRRFCSSAHGICSEDSRRRDLWPYIRRELGPLDAPKSKSGCPAVYMPSLPSRWLWRKQAQRMSLHPLRKSSNECARKSRTLRSINNYKIKVRDRHVGG
jgi:hypothetical protein